MDEFDILGTFLGTIFGIIIGILIGRCIVNKYDTCFIKDGFVYCEMEGKPDEIKKVGVLKGEE